MTRLERSGLQRSAKLDYINKKQQSCFSLLGSLPLLLNRSRISGMVRSKRSVCFYSLTLVSCVSQWSPDARPLPVQLLCVLQKHEEEPVAAVTGQHLHRQLPDGGRGHLQPAGERWDYHIQPLFIWAKDRWLRTLETLETDTPYLSFSFCSCYLFFFEYVENKLKLKTELSPCCHQNANVWTHLKWRCNSRGCQNDSIHQQVAAL